MIYGSLETTSIVLFINIFLMDVSGTYRQLITKKFMRFSNTTVRVLDGCWPWPSRAGSVTLAEGVATSDQSHLGLLGQRQNYGIAIAVFLVIFHIDVSKISSIELVTLK